MFEETSTSARRHRPAAKSSSSSSSSSPSFASSYVKFVLDNSETSSNSGHLVVESKRIERAILKEMQLVQANIKSGLEARKSGGCGEQLLLSSGGGGGCDESELARFRALTVHSANFKAAQCLLNTHKRTHPYNTSRKTLVTSSSSLLLSNYNSTSNKTPTSANNNSANHELISYTELNERLFACLLCNFSCQLVDNFLHTNPLPTPPAIAIKTSSARQRDPTLLKTTGFIRKQQSDQSFVFMSVASSSSASASSSSSSSSVPPSQQLSPSSLSSSPISDSSSNSGCSSSSNYNCTTPSHHHANNNNNNNTLHAENTHIKLHMRLAKWPRSFAADFFKRQRAQTRWPSQRVLDYIEANACLITSFTPTAATDEDTQQQQQQQQSEQRWQVDTSLAESVLFKSLGAMHSLVYQLLFLLYQNVPIELKSNVKSTKAKPAKLYMFHVCPERLFMHHFFRFVELNKIDAPSTAETPSAAAANQTLLHLVELVKRFGAHLRAALLAHRTLNRPNYFELRRSILSASEYASYLHRSTQDEDENDVEQAISGDLIDALLKFDTLVQSQLAGKMKKSGGGLMSNKNLSLLANLHTLDTFLSVAHVRGHAATATVTASTTALGAFSPLVAHYSPDIYVYMYVHDYVNGLFEQFRAKRDHFQISEKLLLDLHESIIRKETRRTLSDHDDDDDDQDDEDANRNAFVETIRHLDREQLFNKFEEYAECVHKYLPQIRQHNQYLLFHYIWTMQVQYLGPFFNYLCDFYPPMN